jgi:multicomponent Na+:H+ antiporter subunit B
VTLRGRLALFGFGAAGLGLLLGWAMTGLPDFGAQTSRYAQILNGTAVAQRHVTNVVAAVVFDYRGFDTLGEEFIVLGSVFGVALLLREVRDETIGRPRDETRSEAVQAVGLAAAALAVLVGLYVLAHGYVTPGGGFQGGVVLASAFALIYLAGSYRAYRRLTPEWLVDGAEAAGAGAYAIVGVVGLLLGLAYLQNLLGNSLGTPGTLGSSGSIAILNIATGLEIAAAFVLIFTEFLEELQVERFQREQTT